ncbi:GNAT family N-acetyltransferase [Pseudomonas sp. CGJS7]|uniref:GNAT family N-acetyltransferase n=1 Tax=Pseudomonas sp. CGJS7 TaxID=3109348 RepID=UPI003008EA06
MSITIEVLDSIGSLDRIDYQGFHQASGASVFYDWRFLDAAERSPLLQLIRPYYLLAKDRGEPVAFLPAYLQRVSVVDPFGLLARRANLSGENGELGLFSHVMHCFNSGIVSTVSRAQVFAPLMDRLSSLAAAANARYFGLLNVADPELVRHAANHRMHANPVVDRYLLDLTEHSGFEALVAAFPAPGRREMNRQLRKFEVSGATARMLSPPFDDRLEQLAGLCQQTTARNGTPQYFPAPELIRFVRLCGDLIRLCLIEQDGELAGGLICLVDKHFFCVWSAGMRYDKTDFSPYTIAFAHAYRHAFELGLPVVEAGRLNERIKLRLGLRPVPLYALTAESPPMPRRTRATVMQAAKEPVHGTE